jgi:hypothetical protein
LVGGNTPAVALRVRDSGVYTGYQTVCRNVPENGPNQCRQVPVAGAGQASAGVARTVPVLPRHQQTTWRRQWRLQKSAPECSPREGDGSLATVAQRVEGRAYGCGDSATASGCEDKAL